MQASPKYTYQDAGFNGFLSRSLKSNPLANTASDGPSVSSGTTVNFDRQQVAAAIGNSLKVGRLILDGVAGRLISTDENGVETAWFGDLTS